MNLTIHSPKIGSAQMLGFLPSSTALLGGVPFVIAQNPCGSTIQLPLIKGINGKKGGKSADYTRQWKRLTLCLTAAACLPLLGSAQSLWRDEVARPMFADKKAVGVGDLLTIVVQENTTASKDNKTATSKKSALDASVSTFLYSPAASGLLTKGGQMPAIKYQMQNDFNGGGTIANSENIVARITVRVIDVLPNRSLVIEGTRETAFGGEKQNIILHGIVRPEDIASNNTLFSYNISDAKVQIINKGTVTDTQRKGWFNRLWDKLTPF